MTYRAVVNCRGHRCAALAPDRAAGGPEVLRRSVADSRDAVLVSTGCLGMCARSPVVGIGTARHEQSRLALQVVSWFGPVGPEQLAALGDHLAEARQDGVLPRELLSAVFTPVAMPDSTVVGGAGSPD